MFLGIEGDVGIFGAFANSDLITNAFPIHGISVFDAGDKMADGARLLADDLIN